ncbi:DNA-binding barrel domain superfamily [Sesbania bispinosa]|nr:DNA-binding barrel domain superfamily [Sesbania bispinosa]
MTSKKHSVPSVIRFFKIITTTCLEAQKLKIPNNFTRKYGGDMSNPMFLKPPDGTEWEIYLTKNDGDIWFQKGWKEFATYYSLDYGHMVLFEYKGTSHFEVHIFDKTTLEIQYPFHGNQDEQDKISDNSVEILEELSPSSCNKRKTKLKSPMPCPQPCQKFRTGTSGGVGSSPKLQNLPEHVYIKDEVGGTTTTTESQKVEQLNLKITEAINRARVTTFGSKNPSFIVVMKPSYIRHGLHVPLQFGEKYLKKKRKLDILLQVLDGRTWPFLIFQVGEEPHYPPPQGDKADGAMKEANKFTSENPFFTVNIKPFSGRVHRPCVPRTFVNNKKTFMLQFEKKLWPVKRPQLGNPFGAVGTIIL